MNTYLLKQIDDLVASKTFNLDALDGIKKLKDSLGAAINDKEHLQNNYDNLSEINVSQLCGYAVDSVLPETTWLECDQRNGS